MTTVTIELKSYPDGSRIAKISSHFSRGKYRRERIWIVSKRQSQRIYHWMHAQPGRLGSHGNGWYTCNL